MNHISSSASQDKRTMRRRNREEDGMVRGWSAEAEPVLEMERVLPQQFLTIATWKS
jgi:hypothetical protein